MTEQNNRELKLERIIDAPRELVFQAWTDPKYLANWWGPRDFTNPVCEVEAKEGGALHIEMQGSDGGVIPCHGIFIEIKEPEKLVFTTTAFADADGNPQLENKNTVTFEEFEGKTKLTVHVVVMKATPTVEAPLSTMESGWNESLDKLIDMLHDKKGL